MKSGFLSKLGGQTGNPAKVSKAYLEGTKHGACRAGAPCGEDHAGISLDAEGASWKGSSSVESIRTAAKQEILSEATRGAVEIGWDDERGNIALARRDYKAGEIVFSDDPIMVVDLESFPPGTLETLDSVCFNATHSTQGMGEERQLVGAMILPALQFVREKDVEKRGRALSMFCPEGDQIPSGFEQGLKKALSQLVRMGFISNGDVDRLAREHGSQDGYDVLARIVMICHCNIFSSSEGSQRPTWHRASLTTGGGLLSHSCLANCNWHFRGGVYILVAVEDIERGEELTQSYLETDRFAPTPVRRDALLASKWMRCDCLRCASEISERCRGFRCRACGSGTVWLPGGDKCDGCGVEPSADAVSGMENLEAKMRSRVDTIDANFTTMGTQQALQSLLDKCGKGMTRHWLLSRVHSMLKEFAKGCMLWEAAAYYANLRAEFQGMVYPVPNTAHSFEMEDVADCLAASAGVSPSLVFTRDYYDMLLEAHGPALRRPPIKIANCPAIPCTSKADRETAARKAYVAYVAAACEQMVVFGRGWHENGGGGSDLAVKFDALVKLMRGMGLEVPDETLLQGAVRVGELEGEGGKGRPQFEGCAAREKAVPESRVVDIDLEELD